LLAKQPLTGPNLVKVVLKSWEAIFDSRLGSGFHIGREIRPNAQIMGFLLHVLIPLEVARTDSNWRAEITASDKDLVYDADEQFSIEIKTSSNRSRIFGNRSFGIDSPGKGKKAKDGYYVAVNFEKWPLESGRLPRVRRIRYGWLDHTDWIGQTAQSGQQSFLPAEVENKQLLAIYPSVDESEGSEEALF
jgi:hypothetical protein